MIYNGIILKMKTKLKSQVQYELPIGKELLPMNQFIGKYLRIKEYPVLNFGHLILMKIQKKSLLM